MLRRSLNVSSLRFGIVGACGRGASFKTACDASGQVVIQAVCDIHEEGLPAAAERLGAREQYTDYAAMLDQCGLDAVVIGTPMQLQCADGGGSSDARNPCSLRGDGGRVRCRVSGPGRSGEGSSGVYMMAENYTYMKPNVIVGEMVRQGLFGTPYYGEGEYLHELKELNERTVWRRRWQTGVAGVTYGTHSLGRCSSGCPATGSFVCAAPGADITTWTLAGTSMRTTTPPSCSARCARAA